MKNAICFVISIVFLCGCLPISNVAYAEYDGEITFRDIPWGSNYEDTMEAIKNSGVNTDEAHAYNSWVQDMSAVVGGKEMSVEINFNSLDPIKKTDDSAFYKATYQAFSNAEFAGRKKALENVEKDTLDYLLKLTSLYGKPDKSEEGKNFSGEPYKNYFWDGANNTHLTLGYSVGFCLPKYL